MENKTNAKTPDTCEQSRDVIYQVSLLQGLAYGDYYGSVTLGELKGNGDTGIGTFDRLNGEMILLDGVVYRAAGDGSVAIVPDAETTPFAVVTFLDADVTKSLRDIPDWDALNDELNKLVQGRGINRFYMIRIDGLFREVNVRSVHAQTAPYQPLADVLSYDQTFFDYENIEGTMVGLYCPPYLSAMNAVGWHMHFLSADRTKGGHVLGAAIADAVLTWDDIDGFRMRLPQNELFSGFDLTVDQSEDIEKIEKNQSKGR